MPDLKAIRLLRPTTEDVNPGGAQTSGDASNSFTSSGVAVATLAVAGVALVLQAQDPRAWNEVGPASGEQYFFPSLA
ncbi:MAG: hypothetical protein AAFU61_17725, partial [Pseudomonadota bacterium]